jgi:hypothetical protein
VNAVVSHIYPEFKSESGIANGGKGPLSVSDAIKYVAYAMTTKDFTTREFSMNVKSCVFERNRDSLDGYILSRVSSETVDFPSTGTRDICKIKSMLYTDELQQPPACDAIVYNSILETKQHPPVFSTHTIPAVYVDAHGVIEPIITEGIFVHVAPNVAACVRMVNLQTMKLNDHRQTISGEVAKTIALSKLLILDMTSTIQSVYGCFLYLISKAGAQASHFVSYGFSVMLDEKKEFKTTAYVNDSLYPSDEGNRPKHPWDFIADITNGDVNYVKLKYQTRTQLCMFYGLALLNFKIVNSDVLAWPTHQWMDDTVFKYVNRCDLIDDIFRRKSSQRMGIADQIGHDGAALISQDVKTRRNWFDTVDGGKPRNDSSWLDDNHSMSNYAAFTRVYGMRALIKLIPPDTFENVYSKIATLIACIDEPLLTLIFGDSKQKQTPYDMIQTTTHNSVATIGRILKSYGSFDLSGAHVKRVKQLIVALTPVTLKYSPNKFRMFDFKSIRTQGDDDKSGIAIQTIESYSNGNNPLPVEVVTQIRDMLPTQQDKSMWDLWNTELNTHIATRKSFNDRKYFNIPGSNSDMTLGFAARLLCLMKCIVHAFPVFSCYLYDHTMNVSKVHMRAGEQFDLFKYELKVHDGVKTIVTRTNHLCETLNHMEHPPSRDRYEIAKFIDDNKISITQLCVIIPALVQCAMGRIYADISEMRNSELVQCIFILDYHYFKTTGRCIELIERGGHMTDKRILTSNINKHAISDEMVLIRIETQACLSDNRDDMRIKFFNGGNPPDAALKRVNEIMNKSMSFL